MNEVLNNAIRDTITFNNLLAILGLCAFIVLIAICIFGFIQFTSPKK